MAKGFSRECLGKFGRRYNLTYSYDISDDRITVVPILDENAIKHDGFARFGNSLAETYCDGRVSPEKVEVVFSIFVHSDYNRRGVGTHLIESLFLAVEEYNKIHKVQINAVIGWLSPADAEKELWEDSLPFYQNLPHRMDKTLFHNISSITGKFILQKSGNTITAEDLMEAKENAFIVYNIQYKHMA